MYVCENIRVDMFWIEMITPTWHRFPLYWKISLLGDPASFVDLCMFKSWVPHKRDNIQVTVVFERILHSLIYIHVNSFPRSSSSQAQRGSSRRKLSRYLFSMIHEVHWTNLGQHLWPGFIQFYPAKLVFHPVNLFLTSGITIISISDVDQKHITFFPIHHEEDVQVTTVFSPHKYGLIKQVVCD